MASNSSPKPWVGGNWKCNGSKTTNSENLKNMDNSQANNVDVVVFPSFIHMEQAMNACNGKYYVGAQNCSMNENGAFTGEVSAKMLEDMQVKCVLCGHSERRQFYGETNEVVGKKMAKVMTTNMTAVLCIGETLEQRNANMTMQICSEQVMSAIPHVSDWSRVVIAYEPIWAIGTGVVASPETAEEVHKDLRSMMSEKVSPEVAKNMRIVYGGSVNKGNCESLIKMPNIDGFLVGGASLKPEFSNIIQTVSDFYAAA